MFRLTREVRFAINSERYDGDSRGPSNSYGGYRSLTGFGRFYSLQVTLAGDVLDLRSSYVRNIKEIDEVVRTTAVGCIDGFVRRMYPHHPRGGFDIPAILMDVMKDAWPGARLETVRLALSPFFCIACNAWEHPLVRSSQKFEFSASHRLHNPSMTDEQNRACFGKCSNPHGHGHNYELQVTLVGQPDENGVLVDIPELERTVAATVIERFDHKNLNVEVPEFAELIPTVENIARVIYSMLKPRFEAKKAKLASVTVWETPKTWCEYSE